MRDANGFTNNCASESDSTHNVVETIRCECNERWRVMHTVPYVSILMEFKYDNRQGRGVADPSGCAATKRRRSQERDEVWRFCGVSDRIQVAALQAGRYRVYWGQTSLLRWTRRSATAVWRNGTGLSEVRYHREPREKELALLQVRGLPGDSTSRRGATATSSGESRRGSLAGEAAAVHACAQLN